MTKIATLSIWPSRFSPDSHASLGSSRTWYPVLRRHNPCSARSLARYAGHLQDRQGRSRLIPRPSATAGHHHESITIMVWTGSG